jgi:hypothetical protein
MNPALARPHAPRLARLATAVVSLLMLLAFAAPASQAAPVTADAVLLQTVPSPWDDEFNEEAMEIVFGTDWETQEFDQVQADAETGGLFAPHVRFIWIEGSEYSTKAADEFVEAHEASLKAFVARGGRLFINSATNEEIDIAYDGRLIGKLGPADFTEVAVAVDPNHPIFKGPATPNATTFKGGSFAHGRVTGPGLTPLIVGTETEPPFPNGVVLADYVSGAGRVALGSMTAVQHHEPEAESESLLINLIHYLLSPLSVPASPAPPAPAPLADATKPQVKITGLPKGCVEKGFRFRVKVSDESGVGVIRVKLGQSQLREVDGKGKPNRSFKVRVPDTRVEQARLHKIKVIARDSAGNVKRKKVGFRVCK